MGEVWVATHVADTWQAPPDFAALGRHRRGAHPEKDP